MNSDAIGSCKSAVTKQLSRGRYHDDDGEVSTNQRVAAAARPRQHGVRVEHRVTQRTWDIQQQQLRETRQDISEEF